MTRIGAVSVMQSLAAFKQKFRVIVIDCSHDDREDVERGEEGEGTDFGSILARINEPGSADSCTPVSIALGTVTNAGASESREYDYCCVGHAGTKHVPPETAGWIDVPASRE